MRFDTVTGKMKPALHTVISSPETNTDQTLQISDNTRLVTVPGSTETQLIHIRTATDVMTARTYRGLDIATVTTDEKGVEETKGTLSIVQEGLDGIASRYKKEQ